MVEYYSPFGNQFNLLLILSYDLLSLRTMSAGSDSLLFAGWVGVNEQVSGFWGCELGASNAISCRDPQLWTVHPNLLTDSNVLGYRTDYCLLAEQSLNDLCAVRSSLPIMIGKASIFMTTPGSADVLPQLSPLRISVSAYACLMPPFTASCIPRVTMSPLRLSAMPPCDSCLFLTGRPERSAHLGRPISQVLQHGLN